MVDSVPPACRSLVNLILFPSVEIRTRAQGGAQEAMSDGKRFQIYLKNEDPFD